MLTKLVEDVHILKFRKGVPVVATSPAAATPLATTTPSYADTLNMPVSPRIPLVEILMITNQGY